MEEDPQCWRTAPRVMPSSTDTIETTIKTVPVTESSLTSNQKIFYIESETDEKTSEQSSSSRSRSGSFIQSAHETAQIVCQSDIPLDDNWFCDNHQARFKK